MFFDCATNILVKVIQKRGYAELGLALKKDRPRNKFGVTMTLKCHAELGSASSAKFAIIVC